MRIVAVSSASISKPPKLTRGERPSAVEPDQRIADA
jgi:hypothetical protein